MKKQSLVCLIDLLGSKNVHSEEYINSYFSSLHEIEKLLEDSITTFNSINTRNSVSLNYLTFSDNLIIILAISEADNDFYYTYVAKFSQFILGVFQCYLAEELFPRGVISFGEIYQEGKYFLGPVIEDVSEYFEKQEMIGVCFTPKASLALNYAIEFNNEILNYVIKYKTPLKNNLNPELYQIDWINHFIEKPTNGIDSYAMFSNFFARRNIALNSITKIENTFKFYEFVKKSKAENIVDKRLNN